MEVTLTFKKDDGVKYINSESDLIPILIKGGWVEDKPAVEKIEKPAPRKKGNK